MGKRRSRWEVAERLELRLVVRSDWVMVGREAAAQYAEEIGCGTDVLWRVRLAVSEALTNVVQHAHRAEGLATQHVCLLVADACPAGVTMTVQDHGRWRIADADSVGMGLKLIARVSDELSVLVGPGRGSRVQMTFSC